MIEISQGDLSVRSCREALSAYMLPIRFRGAEVELLFIFQSTQ